MSRRAKRKEAVRALLMARDVDGLLSWARQERNPTTVLASLLYAPEELLRWRAVEGLGRLSTQVAEGGLEGVREMVRRAFWAMNDESGGLLWNGPEVIAEILWNVPALVTEYVNLLPHFLREEPFERGAAWALARLAPLRPSALTERADELLTLLRDDDLCRGDPYIRGHLGAAVSLLGRDETRERIRSLTDDRATITVYDSATGELTATAVGTLVSAALVESDVGGYSPLPPPPPCLTGET
ncbi:DVU0298 family protein [Planctomycetota bacterium]